MASSRRLAFGPGGVRLLRHRTTDVWQLIVAARQLDNIVPLSATDLAVASPGLGTPALSQAHALTATALAPASPALDTPALGQVHILAATALATGSPAFGSAALAQVHALTATAIATSSPALGTPALVYVVGLTATAVATGSPALGTPAITQVHSLTATALAPSSPVVGAPALAQLHGLGASAMTTGPPVLATPALVQVHALTATGLTTGSPVLASPALPSGATVPVTLAAKKAVGFAGQTGNYTDTISTGLTNPAGDPYTIQVGDFVVAQFAVGCAVGFDRTITDDGLKGWTAVSPQQFSYGSGFTTSAALFYKFAAGGDQLTITGGTGSTSDGGTLTVLVFKNVDPATPFDVALASATGTATTRANPPSITPVTVGSAVAIFAAGASGTGLLLTGTDYFTGEFASAFGPDNNDSEAAAGVFTHNWQSGAVDPPVLGGGATGVTTSWTAYTLAIRAVGATTPTSVNLAATALATGSPQVGAPSIGQSHALVATNLTTAFAPSVASLNAVRVDLQLAGGSPFQAVGGVKTTPGDGFNYWDFSASEPLTVTVGGELSGYMLVGGGGGGGISNASAAGGGGSGGVKDNIVDGAVLTLHTGDVVDVVVGARGIGSTTISGVSSGGDTYLQIGGVDLTNSLGQAMHAIGGGRGGTATTNPVAGGSGGGGGTSTTASTTGAAGTPGQGNVGGDSKIAATDALLAAGSGGGPAGLGKPGLDGVGGNGGNGRTIRGNVYGGGGGGGGGTTQGVGGGKGGSAKYGPGTDAALVDATGPGGGGGAISFRGSSSGRSGHGFDGAVRLWAPEGGSGTYELVPAAPVLGRPALGGTGGLVANPITTASPVIGKPTLNPVAGTVALSATPLVTGSPSLGTPSLAPIIYVAAAAIGNGSGTSPSNAAAFANIHTIAMSAPAGSKIGILNTAVIMQPGSPRVIGPGNGRLLAPIQIVGVNASGAEAEVIIRGLRHPDPAVVGDPWVYWTPPVDPEQVTPDTNTWTLGYGVFDFADGAAFYTFRNIRVEHVQYFMDFNHGSSALGGVHDIIVEDCSFLDSRYYIDHNRVSGAAAHKLYNMTFRRITGVGHSKACFRVRGATPAEAAYNILYEDIFIDSRRQAGDNFAEGFVLYDYAHDVTYRRCRSDNCHDTQNDDNTKYWNGDGFAGEEQSYNILVEDCQAQGHTDGGIDMKCRDVTVIGGEFWNNKRNLRLWNGTHTVTGTYCHDVFKRGGSGGAFNAALFNNTSLPFQYDPGKEWPWGCDLLLQGCTLVNGDLNVGNFGNQGETPHQTMRVVGCTRTNSNTVLTPGAGTTSMFMVAAVAPAGSPVLNSPPKVSGRVAVSATEGTAFAMPTLTWDRQVAYMDIPGHPAGMQLTHKVNGTIVYTVPAYDSVTPANNIIDFNLLVNDADRSETLLPIRITVVPSSTGGLNANSLVTGSPVTGSPALSIVQSGVVNLLAIGKTTAAPALGAPALSVIRPLTATALATGSPAIAAPALTVVVNLTGNEAVPASPVVGSPAMGQGHALAAVTPDLASPVVGQPSLTGGVALVANATVTASPASTGATELVPNGTFDTATGWSLAATSTISGGVLNKNGSGYDLILVPLVAGARYRAAFDLVRVSGGIGFWCVGGGQQINGPYVTTGGVSHQEWTFTAPSGAPGSVPYSGFLDAGSGFVGTVDNFSVRLDGAIIGQSHSLAANPLATSSPAVGVPAMARIFNAVATTLVTSSPVVGAPVIGQRHAVVATGITTPSPVLGSPGLSVVHKPVAVSLATGSPQLGSPALAQRQVLTVTNLSTGAPGLGAPQMFQNGTMAAVNVATGAPAMGSPGLGQRQVLAASFVATASPVLDHPAFAQRQALTANNAATAAPVLGTPSLVPAIHLTANDVTTSPPVGVATLIQRHALVAGAFALSPPDFGVAAVTVRYGMSATGVVTGAPGIAAPALHVTRILEVFGFGTSPPMVGTPSLGQGHALLAASVQTSAPALGSPSLIVVAGMSAATLTTASPVLGSPAVRQVQRLVAVSVAAIGPAIAAPIIRQVHRLTAENLNAGPPDLGTAAWPPGRAAGRRTVAGHGGREKLVVATSGNRVVHGDGRRVV